MKKQRRSQIGKAGDARGWECVVCGAYTKHRYCKVHDPDKKSKEAAHAERVARYKAKVGRALPPP